MANIDTITDIDEFEDTVAELHDQLLRVSDCLEMADIEEAGNQFELATEYMEQLRQYLTTLQVKVAASEQADSPNKSTSIADNSIETITTNKIETIKEV